MLRSCLLILLLGQFVCLSYAQDAEPKDTNTFKLSVYLAGAAKGDSITLTTSSLFPPFQVKGFDTTITTVMSDDSLFKYVTPVTGNGGYFSLYLTYKKDIGGIDSRALIILQLFEKGDILKARIAPNTPDAETFSVQYTGKGSPKCNVKSLADSMFNHPYSDFKLDYNNTFDRSLPSINTALSIIEKNKYLLSPFSYNILRCDYIYSNAKARIENYGSPLKFSFNDKGLLQMDKTDSFYKEINESPLPQSYCLQSLVFLRYALLAAEQKYRKGNINVVDTDNFYREIKKHYQGRLLDKILLTSLFYNRLPPENDSFLREMYQTLDSQESKNILKTAFINPSKQMFKFSLPDVHGNIVDSKMLYNKIKVVDFWFNGCGACSEEFQKVLSPLEKEFAGNPKIAFVSINSDRIKDRWITALRSGEYAQEKGINLYTDGLGFEHPLIKDLYIFEYPCVLLVDGNDRIIKFNSVDLYNRDSLRKYFIEHLHLAN